MVSALALQRSLLDIEERAVLIAELEQNEDGEGGAGQEASKSKCCSWKTCRRRWYSVCCDVGSISIMMVLSLVLVGVLMLVVVRSLGRPCWLDKLSRYIISAGIFGVATGGTNAIAVFMLLYKIPLICGSG